MAENIRRWFGATTASNDPSISNDLPKPAEETKTSTHKVEVVRLGPVIKHPNADKLALTEIWGYTCIVAIDAGWREGDLAAYILPDSIVPDTEDFAFLAGKFRIKPKRLRGIMSQGLLMRPPAGAKEGDDVAEQMGVTRYDPPIRGSGHPGCKFFSAAAIPGPPGFYPKYDVENFYRYRHLLQEGESVSFSEKIHGAGSRWNYFQGTMYCGSRREWKREDPKDMWWSALEQNPWIREFCEAHSDMTLYGEVCGQVQDLTYSSKPGQYFVRIFDILVGNRWTDFADCAKFIDPGDLPADLPEEFKASCGTAGGPLLRWVPLLYVGPYSEEKLRSYIDGPSTFPGAKHLREGLVVVPYRERYDPRFGRIKLKAVSAEYLSRSKD